MNTIKKISGVLLSICLMMALVPTVVYAASGRISFTDLDTSAGEQFEVKISVTSEGDELGSVEVNLNYDNSMIQFVSGDGVTDNGSTLTYAVAGSGTSTETVMTFLALQEGDASLTIASQVVENSSGTTLDMTEGSSAISIVGGTAVEATVDTATSSDAIVEGASGGSAEISGVAYTVSSEFDASVIPAGYSATTYEYDGATYSGAQGDTSGLVLGYLVSADGTAQFFCYDSSTTSFYPYVQMSISVDSSSYIVLLTTEIEGSLPEQYVETTLTVNGFEFPTWEDKNNAGFYLIHATDMYGEESVYRYDSSELTYQRYDVTTETATEVEEADTSTIMDSIGSYALWMLIAIAVILVVFIVLIIVLGVKLRNRDLELDDLYDELDELQKPQRKKTTATLNDREPVVPTKVPQKRLQERPVHEEPVQAPKRKKKMAEVRELDEFDDMLMGASDSKTNTQQVLDDFDEGFDDDFDGNFDEGFDDDFDEGFDDDFDDDFDEGFDDDFDEGFKAEQYQRDTDFEDVMEELRAKKVPNKRQEVSSTAPRNSIKRAAAKRNTNKNNEDIDYIDL